MRYASVYLQDQLQELDGRFLFHHLHHINENLYYKLIEGNVLIDPPGFDMLKSVLTETDELVTLDYWTIPDYLKILQSSGYSLKPLFLVNPDSVNRFHSIAFRHYRKLFEKTSQVSKNGLFFFVEACFHLKSFDLYEYVSWVSDHISPMHNTKLAPIVSILRTAADFLSKKQFEKKFDKEKAIIHYFLGMKLVEVSEMDEGFSYLFKGLSELEESIDKYQKSDKTGKSFFIELTDWKSLYYSALAYSYSFKGNYKKSNFFFKKERELLSSNNYSLHFNDFPRHKKLGRFNLAENSLLHWLLRTMEDDREIDFESIQYELHELARIFIEQKRTEAAISILEDLLAYLEKFGSYGFRLPILIADLGEAFFQNGDFGMAKETVQNAVLLFEELNPVSPKLGWTLISLAKIHKVEGTLSFEEVIEVFDRGFGLLLRRYHPRTTEMLRAYLEFYEINVGHEAEKVLMRNLLDLLKVSVQIQGRYHAFNKRILLLMEHIDPSKALENRKYFDEIERLEGFSIRLDDEEYQFDLVNDQQKKDNLISLLSASKTPFLNQKEIDDVTFSMGTLPFYRTTEIVELRFNQSNSKSNKYFFLHENELFFIHNQNSSIYPFAKKLGLHLNERTAKLYVKFFFDTVFGRHGRFYIVEDVNEIPFRLDIEEEIKSDCEKKLKGIIHSMALELDGDHYVGLAYMVFKSSLFEVKVVLNVEDGVVSINDEKEIEEDLPLRIDYFPDDIPLTH